MRKPNTKSANAAATPKKPNPESRPSVKGRTKSPRSQNPQVEILAPITAKAPSKSNQVLVLLQRNKGASLAELQHVTGWQAHSVRGFLSGTVKKRLGLNLTSEAFEKDGRRYRIIGA